MSFFCKHCGLEFSDLKSLTTFNNCAMNYPSGKHEAFGGIISNTYYCIYCGMAFGTSYKSPLRALVYGRCNKNPIINGYHVPYEGRYINPFRCKYCGESFGTLQSLIHSPCNRSSSKHHEPL